jgi:hypothetical protein
MSAMDRPKNRCVWMIGVIDTIGICVERLDVDLAVLGQQDFIAARAAGRDLVKAGLAVALVVQPAVMLGDFNLAGGSLISEPPLLILVNRVALDLLDVGHANIGRDFLDDLLVKALADQLGVGRDNPVESVVGILERAGVAGNAELFRRDADDLGLRVFLGADNRNVMQTRRGKLVRGHLGLRQVAAYCSSAASSSRGSSSASSPAIFTVCSMISTSSSWAGSSRICSSLRS